MTSGMMNMFVHVVIVLSCMRFVESGYPVSGDIPVGAMSYGKLSERQRHKYCHHRAACGTRAQPGPLLSLSDPSSTQDGFECVCFGKGEDGSIQPECYRGFCDYGTTLLFSHHTPLHLLEPTHTHRKSKTHNTRKSC